MIDHDFFYHKKIDGKNYSQHNPDKQPEPTTNFTDRPTRETFMVCSANYLLCVLKKRATQFTDSREFNSKLEKP